MKERTGWYSSYAYEQIKTILRYKFFSLSQHGYIVTQEECDKLLAEQDEGGKHLTKTLPSYRPTKHNMAKGALRPEDALVHSPTRSLEALTHMRSQAKRLKATLDQRARDFPE